MDYNSEKVKLAAQVVQSFMQVGRTLTKFTQQNAASLGLSVQQMGILNTIYATPGLTLKEITQKLQLPKSTVSITVDDLVKSALVDRQPSASDRREVNLQLTDNGKELAKKSVQNATSYRATIKALEKMTTKDISELIRIHKELLVHLQEQ